MLAALEERGPEDHAVEGPEPVDDRQRSRPSTLTFLGNFGSGNLGNEFTLRSIVQNTRKYLPDARLHCVCPGPEGASAIHDVSASRMTYRNDPAYVSRDSSRYKHPLFRFLRRLFVRLPLELIEWRDAFRRLKNTDLLIMPGTGMLGDFGIGPLDLHYQILKWSIVARMRGCRPVFVSVGAGPIDHPVSRWMVKCALSLAHYRSYRDRFSERYLDSLGFDTSRDAVYPDLAFSLLSPGIPASTDSTDSTHPTGAPRVVGVGLMDYYGKSSCAESGEPVYRHYLDTLAHFVAGLLERKYAVRLLIGDLSYDRRVKGDLVRILQDRGVALAEGQIVDEPVHSLDQLWAQLARTDVVVATRFHNILLALMLGKPVIALSYHQKIRSLMSAVGLEEYCQDIEGLDAQRLMEQFLALDANAASVTASVRRKAAECRAALDEQYRHIFNALHASR